MALKLYRIIYICIYLYMYIRRFKRKVTRKEQDYGRQRSLFFQDPDTNEIEAGDCHPAV